MTPLRWLVAFGIAVLTAFWLHALANAPAVTVLSVPDAPTYVLRCHDPGFSWCGGDTFSIERYAPDGHYRDDGSVPLAGQTTR